MRAFLDERGSRLEDIVESRGFARNAAIVAAIIAAKEAANENDQARKRFEVMAREVFKKFKACINVAGVNQRRHDVDAISIVYKSLQDDRDKADITDILRALHQVVDEAIATHGPVTAAEPRPYDISKIDFDRLRKEFERSPAKRTTVQNLRQAIENRLARLIAQNPLRTDFQAHYEKIVAEYNQEKDRVTIEKTFEALLRFVAELDSEQDRALREGLDEETLALYDLLVKPEITKTEIARIKNVAAGLLATLKERLKSISDWRERAASRDAVRVAIRDYLWDERTGLPLERYDEADVETLAGEVFWHVFRVYPTVPSPVYSVH